jgi:hypothetical protein
VADTVAGPALSPTASTAKRGKVNASSPSRSPAAAEEADVDLVHYDRDYERIAAVGALRQEWLVPDGTMA